MLFPSIGRGDGCQCIGCGDSPYEGIGSAVRKNDGNWGIVTICFGCLAKAAVGEQKWQQALGAPPPPPEPPIVPEPTPIKPRWFGE